MVFKISPLKAARASAFTLVETMVAMAIGMVALAAATVLWGYASTTCASLMNYSEMSMESKHALDVMTQKLRNARSLKSFSANQIVLFDPDGVEVTLDYNSGNGKVTLTQGIATKTLLNSCSTFEFKVYQRTPSNGTDGLVFALTTNTAKVVEMKWACSRKLTGDKNNIENVKSSKVVLRSQ